MYLFNRLVPEIEGFWLFPDNRILSAAVLRHVLSYARRHRIQVAVFNESLLEMGAAISSTSVSADVADKVITAVDHFARGQGDQLPNLTALSDIDLETNTEVAARHGLNTAEAISESQVGGAP